MSNYIDILVNRTNTTLFISDLLKAFTLKDNLTPAYTFDSYREKYLDDAFGENGYLIANASNMYCLYDFGALLASTILVRFVKMDHLIINQYKQELSNNLFSLMKRNMM